MQSHNALNETERYHTYLQHNYERVQSDHDGMKAGTIIALAVKHCNDTEVSSKMVFTLSIFVGVPRVIVHPHDKPNQRQRTSARHTARSRMSRLTAKSRLATVVNRLKHKCYGP